MINIPSDCLPSSVPEATLLLTANLNTEITLPPHSSLVSGVYNLTLTPPNIQKLNTPVELVIEHCVNLMPGEESNLSFVVARGILPTRFDYLEGGSFYVNPKTNKKYGKILLSSFSKFGISWIYGLLGAADIDCNGRLYYDDSELNCRKVKLVITKNLAIANTVRIALANTNEIQL